MLSSDTLSSSDQSGTEFIDAINDLKRHKLAESLVAEKKVKKITSRLKHNNMSELDLKLAYGIFKRDIKKDQHVHAKITTLKRHMSTIKTERKQGAAE